MESRRLKEAIKRAGLSQASIARRFDVDANTVWRWTAGRSEPDDQTKKELAELLGVSIAWLMGESGETAPRVDAEPRYRASRDLDRVMRDLASYDPDFGVLFRGMTMNWEQLPERTKEKIAQIFKVGLGLAEIDDLGGREPSSDDDL